MKKTNVNLIVAIVVVALVSTALVKTAEYIFGPVNVFVFSTVVVGLAGICVTLKK
jgi:hypothetical protein